MVTLIIYHLECGHKVTGPATLVSGELHCPWHHERSVIAEVIDLEWRAKCTSCKFSRWAGLSEKTAEMFANNHARKVGNQRHRIKVELAQNPEAVKTKAKFDAWHVRSKS